MHRAPFTGWDVDGGYAEYAVVDEHSPTSSPTAFSDDEAAPLLCAGIIGYRALRRSSSRRAGGSGIYGFGGSAHLTAQVALAEGATVHVHDPGPRGPARWPSNWARPAPGAPTTPHPSRSTRPSSSRPWGPWSSPALAALDRGRHPGHRRHPPVSDIPALDYQRHLFEERTLRSVTANTRRRR